MKQKDFKKGIMDGLPICFGYFPVAFAFGIFAHSAGISSWEVVLISLSNVTSAGQLAAVPIMTAGGSLWQMALSQFVINLRYALMSVSLSQKMDASVRLGDRFVISFVNTDEVFAVASSAGGKLGRNYMYGLIITPYVGWASGTFFGVLAGEILPSVIISALGVAIYGMFIAIVVPPSKKEFSTALCVMIAVILSLVLTFVPLFSFIPDGVAVIVCSVIAAGIMAAVAPRKGEAEKI